MRLAIRRRGVLLLAAAGLTVVLLGGWLTAGGSLAPTGDTAMAEQGGAAVSQSGPSESGAAAPLVVEQEHTDRGMDGAESAKSGFAAGSADDALSSGNAPSAGIAVPSAGGESSNPASDGVPSVGIMAAPAPRLTPPMSKIAPPAPGPTAPPVPVDLAPDRSIVRTARLGLTVADLPAVSATVRDAASSVGGYVSSEDTVDKSAMFTLRVPCTRLDEVMGRLAASGTVTERYGQAEDVTDQMVDLQSRLATQQASVARVRALLARATTVGEVVSVESELTSREADLESLQRRLASVGGRVELSTLTVSLAPGPVAAPAPVDGGFVAGLAAGWRTFVITGAGVLTALGAVLPFLVLIAVIVGFVLLGRRAVRRHRAATAALAAVSSGCPRRGWREVGERRNEATRPR
jgi:hypothetical protein